jgi:hypothetical protein
LENIVISVQRISGSQAVRALAMFIVVVRQTQHSFFGQHRGTKMTIPGRNIINDITFHPHKENCILTK